MKLGRIRHSAKHRAKVIALRDRFPRMVVRRFLVSDRVLSKMHVGEMRSLIRIPRNSFIEQFARLDIAAIEFIVTHPSHLPILVDGRFVEEVKA
jgi:hypothetical protein